jgi:hypothetical protein
MVSYPRFPNRASAEADLGLVTCSEVTAKLEAAFYYYLN